MAKYLFADMEMITILMVLWREIEVSVPDRSFRGRLNLY